MMNPPVVVTGEQAAFGVPPEVHSATVSYGWVGDAGRGLPGQPFDAYEGFLNYSAVAPASTVLARRDLLLDLGGFALGFRFQAEDQAMWTRVAKRAPVFYLPRPLALYRVHPASWSSRQSPLSVVDAETECVLHLASDAGGIDGPIADALARIVRCYWLLDGISFRLRLQRSLEIARRLRAYGALRGFMVRRAGLLGRAAVRGDWRLVFPRGGRKGGQPRRSPRPPTPWSLAPGP